jgi:hypothetical protein
MNFCQAANYADNNVEKVVSVVKALLEKYVLLCQANPALSGKIYSTGDILVVTCYDNELTEQISKTASAYINVFSQSYIGGGWICSDQSRDAANSLSPVNTTVKFTKLSFNQGEVISVNKLIPNADGNVFVNLANVLSVDGKHDDSIILAGNIKQIRDVACDGSALDTVPTGAGLVAQKDFQTRFVFNDRTRNAGYAYTTLDEFADLNIKTKEVTDFISAALTSEVARATSAE